MQLPGCFKALPARLIKIILTVSMHIAIIIPAYEPNMVLLRLLEELNGLYDSAKYSVKYIIVDDGSLSETSKKTFAKINHLRRAVILKHQKNQGKGAALKTGIKYAHELNVDLIITADADGQHTADDIKSVGDYACEHQNFTIGSRDFKGGIPVRSQIGNFITSKLFKLVFKLNITDTQSGLRAFPSRLFDELLLIKQNRYEYEFQSLIEISKKNKLTQFQYKQFMNR